MRTRRDFRSKFSMRSTGGHPFSTYTKFSQKLTFQSCKAVQGAMGRALKYGYNHESIVLYFTVRISANHTNSILVYFVGCLFHVLRTLSNQWLPNYLKNIISSNKLSLGFVLSTSVS